MDAQQQAFLDRLKAIHLDFRQKTRDILQRLGLFVDTATPLEAGSPAIVANKISIYYGAEASDADKLISDMVSREELEVLQTTGDIWRGICEDAQLKVELPEIQAEFTNEKHECIIRGVDISDLIQSWRSSGTPKDGVILHLDLKIPAPEMSEISCIMDDVEFAEVVAGWLAFTPSNDQTVHVNLITRRKRIEVKL
jgi:hypothetical protein